MCVKSCFLDVCFVHQDLMVPGSEVQFGDSCYPVEFLQQLVHFIHSQNQEVIEDGEFVKSPISHTEMPASSFLTKRIRLAYRLVESAANLFMNHPARSSEACNYSKVVC